MTPLDATGAPATHRGEAGTAYPVFVDHHVHLALCDPAGLAGTGIGAVVDLGWGPEIADLARTAPVHVEFAGQFLTEPDGYPTSRPWAPRAAARELSHPREAAAAVAEQRALGAGVIKLALNREAGPVPDLATCQAVVAAADDLPVVAHVEGAGMVELALAAGVDTLAHAPWTHTLEADVLAECAGAGMRWISTLDIHGRGTRTPEQARALANVAAFAAVGGELLYGTDLGNGPLLPGLNVRELALLEAAGLDPRALLYALTAPWPRAAPDHLVTFVPGQPPEDRLSGWLTGARVVRREELEA
ncbi:hypothetical protein [Nocardioides houyundeii]|uniref:hypothetical protein n=1 Tax=Nocardioides houyundeii TaxID=2045452 RepID=UPI000DF138F5|nr:hypothetical protein [Nocardioides houyundeii]